MSELPRPTAGISPFCRELRSKKLVFSVRPPQTTEDLLDASRHCWCGETLQALGPDGEIVAPEDCRAPRACHKPYLAGRDGGGTP